MDNEKPVVSIDIFDTAVFRDVFYPTDVFRVIENRVGNNFFTQRIEAQKEAARRNASFNILDIYKFLPNFSIKDEILEEIRGTYANPEILSFYKENKEKYDFVFISDMYLPSNVLKVLLEHAGYKEPIVFVSCEEGCMKGAGKLFLKAQEKLGKKIIKHIGDNYNADILGAKKAGILETEYVGPAIYNKEVVTPITKGVKLRKLLIDTECNKTISTGEKIGYYFAPLALLFTESILRKYPYNKNIFFNSRDGFVSYVIARWLLKTDKNIKYCRFSRKSVCFPNIDVQYDLNHEKNKKTLNYLSTMRIISIRDFVNSLRIQVSCDYSFFLKKYNICEDTDISMYPNKQQILKEFLVFIQKDIYRKVETERENFFKYISKKGMNNEDVFVDLGHHGSIQSIIQEITDLKLNGEYIHLFEKHKKLYADKSIKNSFVPFDYFCNYIGIVEAVFSEPSGTVLTYSSSGAPVLAEDSRCRKIATKEILHGLFKGVKDILDKKIKLFYEDCLLVLDRVLRFPTLEEASFANTKIFENGSLFANESITWYNKDIIKKGKLVECYGKSYWKPAFKKLLLNDSEYKDLIGLIK